MGAGGETEGKGDGMGAGGEMEGRREGEKRGKGGAGREVLEDGGGRRKTHEATKICVRHGIDLMASSRGR